MKRPSAESTSQGGIGVDELVVGDRRYRITRAQRADVPALVELLREDVLGSHRENASEADYLTGFDAVDADPAHLLVAVRDEDDAIVATVQLCLLPGLARGGATRLQIEAVRVIERLRGTGLGSAIMDWVADYGRRHGASIVQLTSDKRRDDTHRFYARHGYVASHEGMKLSLQ